MRKKIAADPYLTSENKFIILAPILNQARSDLDQMFTLTTCSDSVLDDTEIVSSSKQLVPRMFIPIDPSMNADGLCKRSRGEN